jgi:hypothetical protein
LLLFGFSFLVAEGECADKLATGVCMHPTTQDAGLNLNVGDMTPLIANMHRASRENGVWKKVTPWDINWYLLNSSCNAVRPLTTRYRLKASFGVLHSRSSSVEGKRDDQLAISAFYAARQMSGLCRTDSATYEVEKRQLLAWVDLLHEGSEFLLARALSFELLVNSDEILLELAEEGRSDNDALLSLSLILLIRDIYHSVREKRRPPRQGISDNDMQLAVRSREVRNRLCQWAPDKPCAR